MKADMNRLYLGSALNVGLWFVFRKLGMWSGLDREHQLALLGGALAGATLVVVLPLFWKRPPWMAPIAFVLTWLPVVFLLQVFLLLLKSG